MYFHYFNYVNKIFLIEIDVLLSCAGLEATRECPGLEADPRCADLTVEVAAGDTIPGHDPAAHTTTGDPGTDTGIHASTQTTSYVTHLLRIMIYRHKYTMC